MKKIYCLILLIMIICVVGCNNNDNKNGEEKQTDKDEGAFSYMEIIEGKVIDVLDKKNTVKLKITKERGGLKKGEIIVLENENVTKEDHHNNENLEPTVKENYKLKKGDILNAQYAGEDDYTVENGVKKICSETSTVYINWDNGNKKNK